MRIRTSGLSVEQAKQLGEVLQQRLVKERLATSQSGRVSTLNLTVKTSGRRSIETIADEIIRSLAKRLN